MCSLLSEMLGGRHAEMRVSPKRRPLSTVFEEYEKIASKSIEDSIKSETHGSLEEAMLTVGKRRSSVLGLMCVRWPWGSEVGQHQRVKGPGCNSKCWVPVFTFKANLHTSPHSQHVPFTQDTGATRGDPRVLNVLCPARDCSLCCHRVPRAV